jgi:hypothetical protein
VGPGVLRIQGQGLLEQQDGALVIAHGHPLAGLQVQAMKVRREEVHDNTIRKIGAKGART